MSALADLENALWRGEYHRLADSHSHRAVREDSLGITKGRDAILGQWVDKAGLMAQVTGDLEDMVAVTGSDNAWLLHRWVWREDGRILREVEITDRPRDLDAPAIHPPIGELRAGRGQYAAPADPDLPSGFPAEASELAKALHRAWNGRAFSEDIPAAIRALISDMPDATFYFEHAVICAGAMAVLFRVAGHHPSGRRIRLIGSHLVQPGVKPQTAIDLPAYIAQQASSHIDYSAA